MDTIPVLPHGYYSCLTTWILFLSRNNVRQGCVCIRDRGMDKLLHPSKTAGCDFSSTTSIQRPWWRHQMGAFFALLAFWAGNSPVTGDLLAQRPVTRSFDDLFISLYRECWTIQLYYTFESHAKRPPLLSILYNFVYVSLHLNPYWARCTTLNDITICQHILNDYVFKPNRPVFWCAL